jgi:hypothetical protein
MVRRGTFELDAMSRSHDLNIDKDTISYLFTEPNAGAFWMLLDSKDVF